jgi:hypothetical protein
VGIAERILSSSEEVAQQEHRVIDKLSKSLLTESQELKLMEKLVRQIG